jgi:hypothetical protein
MKKVLFILAVSALTTQAQVSEGKPVSFKYTHDSILTSRLYDGGVQLKQFVVSDLTITTNVISGVTNYTMKITLPQGLPRGLRLLHATVVDTDGVTESDPSNYVEVRVKPKAPWGFGLF